MQIKTPLKIMKADMNKTFLKSTFLPDLSFIEIDTKTK